MKYSKMMNGKVIIILNVFQFLKMKIPCELLCFYKKTKQKLLIFNFLKINLKDNKFKNMTIFQEVYFMVFGDGMEM